MQTFNSVVVCLALRILGAVLQDIHLAVVLLAD